MFKGIIIFFILISLVILLKSLVNTNLFVEIFLNIELFWLFFFLLNALIIIYQENSTLYIIIFLMFMLSTAELIFIVFMLGFYQTK